MDEDRQAPPLSQRPGYQEAKTVSVEMQKQSRQDMGITVIQRSETKRLNDQLDPELRAYLEWLSTNWAEYFAKERELPTSSSSSQWSSTLVEHTIVVFDQHSWQDD